MEELSRSLKHLAKALVWAVGAFLLVCLEAAVILSHYTHLVVALLLSGADGAPLALDSLLGRFVGAVVGEATMANTMALGIATSLAAGSFFIEYFVEGMVALLRHYDEFRADPVERRLALWSFGQRFLRVCLIALPLVCVVRWDRELFKFRSTAGATGIETATEASGMQSFTILANAHPERAYVGLSGVGATGVVALTFLSTLCFSACLSRVEEHFTVMLEAFGRAFDDEDDVAAVEERTPAAGVLDAPGDGSAGVEAEVATAGGSAEETPIPEADSKGSAQGAGGVEKGAAQPGVSAAAAGLEEVVAAPSCRERREVLGEAGTLLTYEEARRQPARYRISEEAGSIWSVALWEALHERGQEPDLAAAEQSKAA